MGFAFNPFTGNFDQKGSGGGASYIDGEEAVYGDLSLDAVIAPLNSAWLVRSSSGIWPFNKPGGIYIRTATGGVSRDADYTYAGTMPDVFSDAVLTIYDEASTTRTGQFNLGSVTAGQNRVLTWPDTNGTIARTEDFASPPAIGNTTRNTVAATTMSATGAITGAVAGNANATSTCNGFQIPVPAAGGSSAVGMYGTFSNGSQRAVIFGAGTSGSTSTIADFSANGLVANSIQNTPIGGTTPSTGSFTTLSATGTTELVNGGTTAGPFRLYNTFTSATNFERLNLRWASNVAIIGTEKGSANGTARALEFQTDGTTRMRLTTDGTTQLTGSLQISNQTGYTLISGGAFTGLTVTDGNNRVSLHYAGITIRGDSYYGWGPSFNSAVSADTTIRRVSAGLLQINADTAGTYRDLVLRALMVGGTTASFPAVRNSSTTLQVKLADDTAFAPLECAGLTLNGNLTASTRNIVTDITTGTKIGTATDQKIGFWNATPAIQPAAVADATDAASTQARLNDLLARLRTIGIIAT